MSGVPGCLECLDWNRRPANRPYLQDFADFWWNRYFASVKITAEIYHIIILKQNDRMGILHEMTSTKYHSLQDDLGERAKFRPSRSRAPYPAGTLEVVCNIY